MSTEIYDPCETPDHVSRVTNFAHVGAIYMTVAKLMTRGKKIAIEHTNAYCIKIYYLKMRTNLDVRNLDSRRMQLTYTV